MALIFESMSREDMNNRRPTIMADRRAILGDGSIWTWDNENEVWNQTRPPVPKLAAAAASDTPPIGRPSRERSRLETRSRALQVINQLLEGDGCTPAQSEAMSKLEKQGFKFSNWTPTNPDAEGEGRERGQTAVMVKQGQTRFGREYREVDPDGTVN